MSSLWPSDRELDLRTRALLERRVPDAGVSLDVGYRSRPLDWAVERLGVERESLVWSLAPEYAGHQWDGEPDPFVRVFAELAAGRNVGVESGTGTGKTFCAAILALWFLACWEGALVVTVAPKQDQLLLHLWKEISRFWPAFSARFPQAQYLSSGRLRMRPPYDEWVALAFVAGVDADEDSATRAQGFHARHMLLICEETPGVHPAIMTALHNTRTGEHNLMLALGNPDHNADELHRYCLRPDVTAVRVSALDHPNVVTGREIVPGAVGRRSVAQRLEQYGEDGRLYQSRVRGISPAEAVDSLIRRAWCEAAVARYQDESLRQGLRALGVDVANSEAGDQAAIAEGLGAACLSVEAFACPDANELGRSVVARMGASGILERLVGIDSVGVGAGTVNECKRLGKRVQSLNGGERAKQRADEDWRHRERLEDDDLPSTVVQAEQYYNLRSQMWWQLRLDLQSNRIALPADDELIRDLTTPTYTTRNGKIVVEPKEDQRKRLGRSPNKGDAVVYWNWVRQRKPLPAVVQPLPTKNYDRNFERLVGMLERQRKQAERRARRA